MSIYLKDIPLEQAWRRWLLALQESSINGVLGRETLALDEDLVGRVLAESIWAKICSPHYHASAMDGYAVVAEDTQTALPSRPVAIRPGTSAKYVDTGDALPEFANAVIPLEQVETLDERGNPAVDIRKPHIILIRQAVAPWSSIRMMGEDMVATQLVLSAGQRIRPVDLGAIAASGHCEVVVAQKPLVAIIPTGTELVPVGQAVKPGDIIEFNSMVLAGQVQEWGGIAKRYPILADDFDLIVKTTAEAAEEADLILINAGSSAGAEDFTSRVVEKLGKLLVHGVAIRPGHPVVLGMVQNNSGLNVPCIGVPGYPVSAALTGEIFIEPTLDIWTGLVKNPPQEVQAQLTRKVNSSAGDDDYVRLMAGRVGEKLLAAPLPRGAGVISSLVKADGITVLPRGTQGEEAGCSVPVRLYRSPQWLERTLFISGSHDLTLDLLADELFREQIRVLCTNVGSLGGLLALQKQEAHAAGTHLLDPESGDYNISYIRQYVPGEKVYLIRWVKRIQGLMTVHGNPKKVQGLVDLRRPDVTFINRQRGAGTRVLLDYHLKQLAIDPTEISGYPREEVTHLAVAAAVASGRADCGLGIAPAAAALQLDFIPLFHEEYELAIPVENMANPFIQRMLETVRTADFQRRVLNLPGYEIKGMGEIRTVVE